MNSCTVISRGPHLRLLCGFSLVAWTLVVAGCGPAESEGVSDIQNQILELQMPANVASLADSYAAFEEGKSVTLVGRVFSSLGSPFDPEVASFNLIELPKPGHNHDDPGDCPFCKREMENAATAIVQIVDASGQVMRPSAEKLLGLSKNQDIVVVGKVSKVGELLIVNARTIHILSETDALELARRVHGQAG